VIYTPAVHSVRATLGDGLHACAHITGGGIVGNLPRALPAGFGATLERAAWTEPRIFEEIKRLGQVEEDEMDRVFNRGVGMTLVVEAGQVEATVAVLEGAGIAGARIGTVVAEPGVRYA
jgi:phosphoribosylformylglycinamidine cyclo-ligase